jgi:hypothetical protein
MQLFYKKLPLISEIVHNQKGKTSAGQMEIKE